MFSAITFLCEGLRQGFCHAWSNLSSFARRKESSFSYSCGILFVIQIVVNTLQFIIKTLQVCNSIRKYGLDAKIEVTCSRRQAAGEDQAEVDRFLISS